MHLKFLPHGVGNGDDATTYLLRETDHKNEPRPKIKLLTGNPLEIGELINSLKFKHRYSSAVISFSPDEQINRKQIFHLLNDCQKLFFAGLSEDSHV